MNVGIACGGTGGHVFPGLATAEALKKRGHRVVLWLGGREVETASIVKWDGDIVRVRAAGFPSGVSVGSMLSAASLVRAFFYCRSRMRKDGPEVMLGMGSYASVGPVLAAHSLGIPTVLHEANAVPGRAISFLARFADAVAVSFEATVRHVRNRRTVVTGFPLRAALAVGRAGVKNDSGLFTLLVTGGSQGAHALNELVPQAVCEVHARGLRLRAVHLTGRNDEAAVRSIYADAGVPNQVHAFLEDMQCAYGSADLAITRAGAATCAELAAFRLPALLVPLPSARRDHQTANAGVMAEGGGADFVAQQDLTVEWLVRYLEDCTRDSKKLDRMKQALQNRVVRDAAVKLADLVEEFKNADI